MLSFCSCGCASAATMDKNNPTVKQNFFIFSTYKKLSIKYLSKTHL